MPGMCKLHSFLMFWYLISVWTFTAQSNQKQDGLNLVEGKRLRGCVEGGLRIWTERFCHPLHELASVQLSLRNFILLHAKYHKVHLNLERFLAVNMSQHHI